MAGGGSSRRGSPAEAAFARRLGMTPQLADILGPIRASLPDPLPASEIGCHTVWVSMRDGIRLATDILRASHLHSGPTIAIRTPYGRRGHDGMVARALAQYGYVAVVQDCRGTGDSEPDTWDLYVYELEDSFDFVQWLTEQAWYDGFIGSAGGSYVGGTQWCMSFHPKMTAIAPEVAGVGGIHRGVHWHMFMNAYARVVEKGAGREPVSVPDMERRMLVETLTSGYFNAPLDWRVPEELSLPESGEQLWRRYCSLPPAERARLLTTVLHTSSVTLENLESLPPIFGRRHPDEHLTPFPTVEELYRSLQAPALIITGWYDWGLDATLRTWTLLSTYAGSTVRDRSRLLIAPSAHNAPGYHEGAPFDATLRRTFRGLDNIDLLLAWYASMRSDGVSPAPLPRVTYYLMGAGEWCVADDWPPPRMQVRELFLAGGGRLSEVPPERSQPDTYVFDPTNPTPTVAGSYVSSVYRPGSGDVSGIHARPDVAVYTTEPLARPLDVVGPLRCVLYASSTARDTDFAVRLSDVFPDGRAIQLQNGIIRARYRNPDGPAELIQPDRVYRFEIDMWATANRFQTGHRLRIDISSADFPRFDRNANLGGVDGRPVSARQRIFHDPEKASHLLLPVLP